MSAAAAMPLLLALLILSSPAATRLASAACASEKFTSGRSYATCEDLPKLGSSLHGTYDASNTSLSVAFVAASGGWVAWGINPTGEGMAGAQALVALAGSGGGAPTVKTYNISGYALGAPAALEFPATELAADASGGKIRVYGKLQLGKTVTKTGVVNQLRQVGSSVTKGVPDKHAFAADNLNAKGKLVLAGKKATAASPSVSPVPAPEAGGPVGSGDGGAGASVAPSAGKTPNAAVTAAAGVSAPALLAMAVVGFLVAV